MLHGQAEESGYYQCMAENEAGIDIATTYIRFKINGKFISDSEKLYIFSYLSVFRARLFIDALWSPAAKGLPLGICL